ncbi:MAG: type II toxin-antitoxin system RelE/ParE family toxin [Pirellulales bacterium]|nr:type II toxin-antitoxin system RelE/ParE family toxin [Pirellulales bacterium]
MASRRFRLSKQAQTDLSEIQDYIKSRNRQAVGNVLMALHEAFRSLARNPEMGTLCDDLRKDIRLFVPNKPANNYLIFYYPYSDGIEVSTVIHAARDWPSLFVSGGR